MSDPTLTIRIRYKAADGPAVQRTIDVAVRPKLPIEELAVRSGRRVENAVLDLFEDMGGPSITDDPEVTVGDIHSTGNADA